MFFHGEFHHTIDVKNRLFIPAKFREGLGEQFIIYPSPDDGCLFCYSEKRWLEIAEQIEQFSVSPEERAMQRSMLRGVAGVVPDKQGRITLTSYHVDCAGLEKDVVVYGMTGRVEIWDINRFNESLSKTPKVKPQDYGIRM